MPISVNFDPELSMAKLDELKAFAAKGGQHDVRREGGCIVVIHVGTGRRHVTKTLKEHHMERLKRCIMEDLLYGKG